MIYQIALAILGGLTIGGLSGYLIRQSITSKLANSLEQQIKNKLENTELQIKEEISKAKEKAELIIDEVRKEEKERKSIIERTEERLLKKEELLHKDELDLRRKSEEIKKLSEKLAEESLDLENKKQSITGELIKISKLTPEEARKKMFADIEEQHKEELINVIKKLEREKKEEIEKKSLDIITTALQRYSRSHISDITTTVFNLPSEDLKGKIIGREGRNIRALERATGAEFIMDESPGGILISSFDPIRREVAKMTLEKLMQDGRIQPAKIEEQAEEARLLIDKRIQEIGEEAVYEVGILNLPKEINHLLGRLHFRTSYGQNALLHSMEVAFISGMIAEELGINADIARKGALLHDIGKAIDSEVAGNHVDLGIKILKKYDIDPRIIEAMQSHHDDYPYAAPEAFVVATADIISAARPGARRGTVEQYIKRLEDLEKIASSFNGVRDSYAVSAGRELRVFVIPEKIDDFGALQLAKNIASKIESEMKYPGDIKVTIVREVRAVEYAK